ncbi:MAG: stage V sporulation protein G [Planctomycetaceae bacterium]|nr:stage V sporulation protein G [Planctomycetaceae bacterium]
MEITEVRIKLMEEPGERLKAFCSITFDDCFVVRDLKIIEGTGGPFVAMPSRKLTAHCQKCRCKNHLRAAYCNQCGARLKEPEALRDEEGRAKLYADIAHPINSACRELIQQKVITAFERELSESTKPDYRPSYDDFDQYEAAVEEERPPLKPTQVQQAEAPRGPHKAPSFRKESTRSQSERGGFGKGVFD